MASKIVVSTAVIMALLTLTCFLAEKEKEGELIEKSYQYKGRVFRTWDLSDFSMLNNESLICHFHDHVQNSLSLAAGEARLRQPIQMNSSTKNQNVKRLLLFLLLFQINCPSLLW